MAAPLVRVRALGAGIVLAVLEAYAIDGPETGIEPTRELVKAGRPKADGADVLDLVPESHRPSRARTNQ